MRKHLSTLAIWFWPELKSMDAQRRLISMGDILSVLYSFPLVVIGLIWLISITDTGLVREVWGLWLLIFILMVLFNQVNYFIIIEIKDNRYGSSSGSLASMIHWSALLLFGPTAIWLMVIWSFSYFIWTWRKFRSKSIHWNQLRNLSLDLSINSFATLITLLIYESLGGLFPINGLTVNSVTLAMVGLFIQLLLIVTIWTGYIAYHVRIQQQISGEDSTRPLLRFFFLSFGFQFLAHPFAILAAGLYVEDGLFIYLFFITGLLIVAYLTRRLSWAVENSRQQSRQLEQLEQLGRAIINAPPDGSNLQSLLKEYVPKMFPAGRLAICLLDYQILFSHPNDWDPKNNSRWDYILSLNQAKGILATDELPWMNDGSTHNAIIVTPIFKSSTIKAIGGIYIELRKLNQQWDEQNLHNFYPAIQNLGAQISSALSQADTYLHSLEYQNIAQELRLAGRIQSSFLPQIMPNIDGWQIAVTLLPARETSGDFFDVIPLSNGKIGLVIADVMDKGVGPALYMALSRTLIRTYAAEYDADPEVVFFAANERLLKDARANLFVTAFYGILDPSTGKFIYSNAGHNPPFLVNPQNDNHIQSLKRTGIALGIEAETTWDQDSVDIQPGDVLLLYTDGIPDAQNVAGEFFDEDRFIEIPLVNPGHTAHQLQDSILKNMQDFVEDAPQFDDITLMILKRER